MATQNDIAEFVDVAPVSGVTTIDALLNAGCAWCFVTPSPDNILSYTFSISDSTESNVTGLTAFNASQQAAVLALLNYVGTVTGINFVQAGSGAAADFHFAARDIDGSSNTAGLCSNSYAYSFDGAGNILALEADAYIYLDNVEFDSINFNPSAGTNGYEVLLHEIGHALGLKHPFDSSTAAPTVLPDNLDNTDNTVMSYTASGSFKSVFQSLDLAALAFIYVGDGLGGKNYELSGSGAVTSVVSDISKVLGEADTDLLLTGTRHINGTGNNGDNTITGNVGKNILKGLGGADAIDGGAGNDKLEGGDGDDTLNGGEGSDRLFGGAGDDTLDGGAGNDNLSGGAGNDTYSVDDNGNGRGDVVVEKAGEGMDTVISSINYTLAANVEMLTLDGAAGINGTGNRGANTLQGNAGNNQLNGKDGDDSLSGGDGSDILNGGAGSDVLNGDAGNDIFLFDTRLGIANIDVIADFVSGTDDLNLKKSIFKAYKVAIDITGNDFAGFDSTAGETALTAADSASRHFLYDTATGNLFYDADGIGTARAAVQFATLTGAPALAASDLHIV